MNILLDILRDPVSVLIVVLAVAGIALLGWAWRL